MTTDTTISRANLSDLALLMLTALIWASAFTAIKIAVVETGPVWTAAFRVGLGFLALLPVAIFTGATLPRKLNDWGMITLIASLYSVIPFVLISWALLSVNAGTAALLMGTTPFVAMVLAHFVTEDEKINRYKVIGVCLGLSGIVTVIGPQVLLGLGSAKLTSQLAIIAGAWCYVIAGLLLRRVKMEPVEFTIYSLGAGALMLSVVAFIIEGVPSLPGNDAIVALLWLGAFPTGLAYVLRYYLVRRVGVSLFALSMNTIPVFGVVIGAVLLGEVITTEIMLSLTLVICGLLVARLGTATQLNKKRA